MVACDLARNDVQLLFHGDLPEQIAHTKSYGSDQDRLTVFGYPDQMDL
jgi:hypothetical protein